MRVRCGPPGYPGEASESIILGEHIVMTEAELLDFGLMPFRDAFHFKSTDPPPKNATASDLEELAQGGSPASERLKLVRWLLNQGEPKLSMPAPSPLPGLPVILADEVKRLQTHSMDVLATLAVVPFWQRTSVDSRGKAWSLADGVPESEVTFAAGGAPPLKMTVIGHDFVAYKDSVSQVPTTMAAAQAEIRIRAPAQSQNPGLGVVLLLGALRRRPGDIAFTLAAVETANAWVSVTTQLLKDRLQVPRPNDRNVFGVRIDPLLRVPQFAAYPGGHAAVCGALYKLLAWIACRVDRSAEKELHDYAYEIAVNRERAGLHCRLDTEAGWKLGVEMGEAMIAMAQLAAPGEFLSWAAIAAAAQREWP
jgi:hypothetical protein